MVKSNTAAYILSIFCALILFCTVYIDPANLTEKLRFYSENEQKRIEKIIEFISDKNYIFVSLIFHLLGYTILMETIMGKFFIRYILLETGRTLVLAACSNHRYFGIIIISSSHKLYSLTTTITEYFQNAFC